MYSERCQLERVRYWYSERCQLERASYWYSERCKLKGRAEPDPAITVRAIAFLYSFEPISTTTTSIVTSILNIKPSGPRNVGSWYAKFHMTSSWCSVLGFRTVEVRQGQMLLNGSPLIIKGTNRHEHDPFTGHVVSRDAMRADAYAMKALHINAVRSSTHVSRDVARNDTSQRLRLVQQLCVLACTGTREPFPIW